MPFALWLTAALLTPQAALAQQTPPPSATATAQTLPVDTARIRQALAEERRLQLDPAGIRFHVDIIGRTRTFQDLVGDFDLRYGHVARSGMTHADYLHIVTPREFREPTGAAAGEALIGGLVGAGIGKVLSTLLNKLEKAQDARELRQIRERIDHELRELEKRRGGG